MVYESPTHGALVGSTSTRRDGRGTDDRRSMGEQLLAGRIKGRQHHELCKELGIGEVTGYRYIKLALDARIAPTVDEYRRQENERLDATQRAIEENLEAANLLGRRGVEEGLPSLVERAITMRSTQIGLQLRLDERRARLNGLDAPINVNVEHTTIDPMDAEMAAMVAEAKREKAAREGQPEEVGS